jgi:predicted house-cleaning NTP pyrophosphatase (Maf/HAM1 superfamily)
LGGEPNGEDYRQRISAAGRRDLLEYLASTLAPKVQTVDEEFAKEHELPRDRRLEQALRKAQKAVAKVPGGQVGAVPADIIYQLEVEGSDASRTKARRRV